MIANCTIYLTKYSYTDPATSLVTMHLSCKLLQTAFHLLWGKGGGGGGVKGVEGVGKGGGGKRGWRVGVEGVEGGGRGGGGWG